MDHFEELTKGLENHILRHATGHDSRIYYRLRTVPGIGQVLALVILYEVQDMGRFPSVQSFCLSGRNALSNAPASVMGSRVMPI